MVPPEDTTTTSPSDDTTSHVEVSYPTTTSPQDATTYTATTPPGEYTDTTVTIPTASTSPVLTTAFPTTVATSAGSGKITTTIIIGSLTTKTYVITTTTEIVLLVTDTQTYTTVSTLTLSSALVDYSTSTEVSPISTFTSTAHYYPGYQNGTSAEESLYLSTEWTTYFSSYPYTRYTQSLSFVTETYEEVVTSTLIVWGEDYTNSYSISTGYNTLVSTIYPETQIATLTSNIESATATSVYSQTPVYVATSTATQVHTVTVTPSVTQSFSAPNVCAGVAQTLQTDNIHVESLYSAHAGKIHIKFNWVYLVIMMLALF